MQYPYLPNNSEFNRKITSLKILIKRPKILSSNFDDIGSNFPKDHTDFWKVIKNHRFHTPRQTNSSAIDTTNVDPVMFSRIVRLFLGQKVHTQTPRAPRSITVTNLRPMQTLTRKCWKINEKISSLNILRIQIESAASKLAIWATWAIQATYYSRYVSRIIDESRCIIDVSRCRRNTINVICTFILYVDVSIWSYQMYLAAKLSSIRRSIVGFYRISGNKG